MVSVFLEDGSSKTVEDGASGLDLAKAISTSLAKKAIALEINGVVRDLGTPIQDGDKVKIIKVGDNRSYDVLRHTTSHVLAAVVQKMFPSAKVGVGPATERGFFYDFKILDHKITDEDLLKIEKEMKRFAEGAHTIERALVEDVDAKFL